MREEQNDLIDVLALRSRHTPGRQKPRPDLEAQVAGWLDRLTPRQRQVVEVRGFGGHSWAETARILGTSVPNVYELWHRAVERMVGITHPSLERTRRTSRVYRPRTPEQKERRRQRDRERMSRTALSDHAPR